MKQYTKRMANITWRQKRQGGRSGMKAIVTWTQKMIQIMQNDTKENMAHRVNMTLRKMRQGVEDDAGAQNARRQTRRGRLGGPR